LVVVLCVIFVANGVKLPSRLPGTPRSLSAGLAAGSAVLASNSRDKSGPGQGGVDKVVDTVKASLIRVLAGLQSIPATFQKQQRLKNLRKQRGDAALSFADFKFLERAGDDVGKLLRAGLFCVVSPEYFFYTYLVIPVMSGKNAWAWRTLPSGFDTEDDRDARERICVHRRQAALTSALSLFYSGCAEDSDDKTRSKRVEQLAVIQQALEAAATSKGMAAALEVLHPWLEQQPGAGRGRGRAVAGMAAGGAPGGKGGKGGKGDKTQGRARARSSATAAAPAAASTTTTTATAAATKAARSPAVAALRSSPADPKAKLAIPEVPWPTIKDMVRSVGIDGVPNLWILRRLNRGELTRHFDAIRSEDEFLYYHAPGGVAALAEDELVGCCISRGISTDATRAERDLRADLAGWLDLTASPAAREAGRNEQNARLALACLHVGRDVARDAGGLGGVLRAVLKS